MIDLSSIREHAEVIGSDGKHVGTVDHVEGNRIKLTKADNPAGHQDHHHFIDANLVQSVKDGRVQLSVASTQARGQEQEEGGSAIN